MAKPKVNIATTKTVYSSGETVTGCVQIDGSSLGNTAVLRVSGTEKIRWLGTTIGSIGGMPAAVTKNRIKEQVIFDKTVPISEAGGCFTFLLPSNLPGSSKFHIGQVKGSIEYKISVEVSGSVVDHIFFVKQHQPVLYQVKDEYDGPVSNCCLMSKGNASMEVYTDKTFYKPGDDVNVTVSVNNRSRKDINKLVVSLDQIVLLDSVEGRVCKTVKSKSYPGISKSSRQDLLCLTFPIPKELEQNTLGNVVRMYYNISVYASVSWSLGIGCRVPISICGSDSTLVASTVVLRGPRVEISLESETFEPAVFPLMKFPDLFQLLEQS